MSLDSGAPNPALPAAIPLRPESVEETGLSFVEL
jgi:hypothetical protein